MFRGTVIAQLIAVIAGVYLAKLYGEEAYGFFGVFFSLVNIFSITSTLQLDKCIVTSDSEEESSNLLSFVLIIVPVIVCLLVVLNFILTYFFDLNVNNQVLVFSFFGAILFANNGTLEHFLTFLKKFSIISNSKIYVTIINIFLQLILFNYYKSFGLIIGVLISQFILFIYFLVINRKQIKKPNFKLTKVTLKKNTNTVKYLFPSSTINSIANNIMPILILTFFNAKVAGIYFLSFKLLGALLFLISSSVSQVFFQKASELFKSNKNKLLSLTKRVVINNVLIMLFLLVLINTIGIYILELFFNNKWIDLRLFIFTLSFLILARASFNPISSLTIVLNKNHIALIFNIYLLLVNLIAIYIGYLYSNLFYTLLSLSIFGAIGYLVLIIYFFNHLKEISDV